MTTNDEIYNGRFALLNEAQKEAVNTIYGPVMVIAGPGTGKTEVLSMRIANLLRSEAQVAPQEILCLTYTEEAAFNMRRRLLQIVGQPAHKVNINTFHGFCNTIIQGNMEYFGLRNLQLLTDLERVDMMQELISKLPPDHPMHRVGNSIFYDLRPLNNFFNEMKKENWTEAGIKDAVSAYLEDLPSRDQYLYKVSRGNNKKGDVKQNEIDMETERMNRTLAAASLFSAYNKAMVAAGRYDFSDMILWVIDAFKKYPHLLQHYQERFQYILVDEFQDTNGAQNELLQQLTGYWDEPNIFVVGDDDQSIYEFQGARIRNIIDFYERYKDVVKVVVMTDNYRSSQPILDRASDTIEQNRQRLVHAVSGLHFDKKIRSALPRFEQEETPAPIVTAYYNVLHEEVAIVQHIAALQEQGVALDKVAVIYSQHKQADNIIAMMERKGLPYTIRRSINALDTLIAAQVLRLFRYLEEEQRKNFSAEHLLFELMHAPYWGVAPSDMATLAIYLNSKEAREKNIRYWRQLLAHEMILLTLPLKTLPKILQVARLLDSWLQQMQVLRLPMLLEKIVYDSGMVQWLLQGSDAAWQMQVLQTLFDFVKSVTEPEPLMSLTEFLQVVEQMRSEQIELPVLRVVQQERGVKFYTAHSSKGLEFEYVFLIGCTDSFWEKKKSMSGLKLPDTLTRTVDDTDHDYRIEVARRLFYVALTRAQKHLYVSYALLKNDGKPQQASLFVDEISRPEERITYAVPADTLIHELALAMKPVEQVYIKLVDQGLMEKQLENFALSASSLSKYLDCPVRFYYEEVLRTPVAENDSMAFGVAVHYALERSFLEMKKSPDQQFPALEEVLGYFRYKMRDRQVAFTEVQYERRMTKGIEMLTEYYTDNAPSWTKDVELEKWLQATVNNVPVKGKIDKIEMLDIYHCRVIDYKTGNPDSTYARDNLSAPNAKNEKGGDYWRQMVFYKLLVENQPFNRLAVGEGIFEYVEKSKKGAPYGHKVILLPDDERQVREQIVQVYDNVRRFQFSEGCGKEECPWCTFVREQQLSVPLIREADER